MQTMEALEWIKGRDEFGRREGLVGSHPRLKVEYIQSLQGNIVVHWILLRQAL